MKKKEIMIILDNATKYESILESEEYKTSKSLAYTYDSKDHFDLGYAFGYADAVSNITESVANKIKEKEGFDPELIQNNCCDICAIAMSNADKRQKDN